MDAVIDPLSAIGQKLSPLLVLLQEWIKPSMRICFNPMVSTSISSVPDLLLCTFMHLFSIQCNTVDQDDPPIAVVINVKTDHLIFVFMQSSLADVPLKNFYRFVLPVKVGLTP